MFFSSTKIRALKGRIAELEAWLAEYRQVLEFYASERNWKEGMKYRDADDSTVFTDPKTSAVMHDNGRRARGVLQDDKTELVGKTTFDDKTEFKE